jgi:hypothetical protein
MVQNSVYTTGGKTVQTTAASIIQLCQKNLVHNQDITAKSAHLVVPQQAATAAIYPRPYHGKTNCTNSWKKWCKAQAVCGNPDGVEAQLQLCWQQQTCCTCFMQHLFPLRAAKTKWGFYHTGGTDTLRAKKTTPGNQTKKITAQTLQQATPQEATACSELLLLC